MRGVALESMVDQLRAPESARGRDDRGSPRRTERGSQRLTHRPRYPRAAAASLSATIRRTSSGPSPSSASSEFRGGLEEGLRTITRTAAGAVQGPRDCNVRRSAGLIRLRPQTDPNRGEGRGRVRREANETPNGNRVDRPRRFRRRSSSSGIWQVYVFASGWGAARVDLGSALERLRRGTIGPVVRPPRASGTSPADGPVRAGRGENTVEVLVVLGVEEPGARENAMGRAPGSVKRPARGAGARGRPPQQAGRQQWQLSRSADDGPDEARRHVENLPRKPQS